MQTLFVQEKQGLDETGKLKKVEKKIAVIRSWSDSSGKAIYLHANGVYGYKDGSPIRTMQELDIIGTQSLHRNIAISWWERRGKKMSEDYWAAKEESEKKRLLEATPDFATVGIDVRDQALYSRRPAAKRANNLFGDPMHWWEFGFTSRPPWWGLLTKAEDANWYYRLTNPETVGLTKAETTGGEGSEQLDS